MTLRIYRNPPTDYATFGTMSLDGVPLCVTLEPSWQQNRKGISCIPAGLYHCVPHSGPRFKNVWELQGVTDREAILIHPLNLPTQTQGCIGVGRYFAQFKTGAGIAESRATLAMLRARLPERFDLEIMEPYSSR